MRIAIEAATTEDDNTIAGRVSIDGQTQDVLVRPWPDESESAVLMRVAGAIFRRCQNHAYKYDAVAHDPDTEESA